YRRREPVVLPRPGPLRGGDRRPRHAPAALAEDARGRRGARPGDAVRHRGRSGGRALAPGGEGVSVDVDGRQGGRLGGDAAAGQGGGDQRAVVQRAVPLARLAGGRARGGRGGGTGRADPAGEGVLQRPVLVPGARPPVRRGGRRGGGRPGVPA